MNINKRFNVAKASNVKRLLTTLANTKLAAGDAKSISWNSVYQTIFGLINNVGDNEDKTNAAITSIQNTISGGGGGGGGTGLLGASYITENPEALLPNSRQLVAGTGITLTDLGTQLEVSAISPNELGYWTLLTDGDLVETDFIFADGDAISIWVPL